MAGGYTIPENNLDFASLADLKANPLSNTGRFGEGQVQDALDRLQKIQDAYKRGDITQTQAKTYADPLVKQAAAVTGSVSSGSSGAADRVNPIWAEIQSEGFVKADNGKWVTQDIPEESTRSAPVFVIHEKEGKSTGIGNVLKKAANVAVQTAAGFAGGGQVGALYGAAKGVKDNTKTSQAKTTNLRVAGQAFVGGAVANIAVGTAAAAIHALPAAGAGGSTGLLAKAAAWAKGGGLSGAVVSNFGNIVKGAGQFLSKGGAIPSAATPPLVGSNDISGGDVTSIADKALTGYRKIRDALPAGAGKDVEASIRSNVQQKTRDFVRATGNGSSESAGGQPIVVSNTAPGATSGGGIDTTTLLIGGAVLLAGLYIFKGR